MKKYYAFLILSLPMSVVYTSEPSSDTIRNSSGFNRPSSSQESSTSVTANGSIEVQVDSTQIIAEACTRKEQTSLPLWVLEKIIEKDHLSVQTVPATMSSPGKIHLNGGGMVGNCNSMLDFKWSVGEGTGKHYFQAKVRKPLEGCSQGADGKERCGYKVQTATNSIPDDEKKTENYEPNYYGFLKCLEDTGAMKANGEFEFSKVAETKFELTQSGVNSTGEIEYYCHGPECSKDVNGKIIGRSGNSCQNFQDITPGGASILSRNDKKEAELNAKFQKACASGDYNIIDASLPDFEKFSSFYNVLVNLRNNLLESKIKELKSNLKAESYEDLDVNEYNSTIKDFYSMIILPARLEVERLHKLVKSSSGDVKKNFETRLNNAVTKLANYTQGDYLTISDYDKMLSFAKKAPIHKDKWREAAFYAYKGINTAFHFARYNKELGKKVAAKEKAAGRDYPLNISLKSALAKITRDVKEQGYKIDKLGNLANDTDGSISYANDELKEAQKIQKRHQYRIQSLGKEMQQEQQTQRQCFSGVSSMMPYLAQKCAQKSAQRMSAIQNDINYYTQPDYRKYVIDPQITNRMNLANQWAGIERDRNLAYGITPQSRTSEFLSPWDANQTLPYSQDFLTRNNQMRMEAQNQWISGLQNQNNWNGWSFQNRQPSGNFPQQGFQGNQNWMFMQPQQNQFQQQNQWSFNRGW